jgi:hypothetical protein
MKTSTQKRIARLSGLLLLALLVVALSVPAAQAMRTSGTSVPSASAGSGAASLAQRPTQAQILRVHGGANGPFVGSGGGTVTAAQSTPSGTSATTVWIAVGAAVAVLIIALVAWALIRRRSSVPGGSAYCARHPGDPLCEAG